MPDGLSVIVIQIDSLNRHFLPTYGNDWVQAPNLTAFADRAAVFERHYVGSLPCMPARREIWAGTEEFWWRGWGPLEPWDLSIARQAVQHGIVSHLITDHYHFFEWGSHNYPYDFDGYEFIRGHEYDNWRTDPITVIPDWATVMAQRIPEGALQYLRNVQDFRSEADFFAPKVMSATADWLRRNHEHPQFYLHVDCFDVHEPFHIPEPYRSMYSDDDYRRYSPWPIYGRIDAPPADLSPAELAWVRAQFAGKLTMVDRWLGHVFDALDEHRLWERTAVIITTDHGHYLGEHGRIGKPHSPMWHTLCHIPLLVWVPGGRAQHINAITQTVDHYATALELLGITPPQREHLHSRTYLPCLTDGKTEHRPYAVYGYSNRMVGITDVEWTLLRDHSDAAPAVAYTHQVEHLNGFGIGTRKGWRREDYHDLEAGHFIPGLDMPVWKMPLHNFTTPDPRPDLLYHNPTDPAQEQNLASQRPDRIAALEALLRTHAINIGAPEAQLQRLRLV
jgi:arylsulfatase A-like enzyme